MASASNTLSEHLLAEHAPEPTEVYGPTPEGSDWEIPQLPIPDSSRANTVKRSGKRDPKRVRQINKDVTEALGAVWAELEQFHTIIEGKSDCAEVGVVLERLNMTIGELSVAIEGKSDRVEMEAALERLNTTIGDLSIAIEGKSDSAEMVAAFERLNTTVGELSVDIEGKSDRVEVQAAFECLNTTIGEFSMAIDGKSDRAEMEAALKQVNTAIEELNKVRGNSERSEVEVENAGRKPTMMPMVNAVVVLLAAVVFGGFVGGLFAEYRFQQLADTVAAKANANEVPTNEDFQKMDKAFRASMSQKVDQASLVPIYRYLGGQSRSPEHFYTANPSVEHLGAYDLEGIAFRALP